jgi:hypothetical protein
MSKNAASATRAIRHCLLLVVLTGGLLLSSGGPASAYKFGEPFVKAIGPEEMVFRHNTDACQQDDIPDIPARAFKDALGRTQLLASHYNTRREIGPDLDHVTHNCAVVLWSDVDGDPSHYSDAEWLHSLYTLDGQTVYGFIHDEYQGWNFDADCAALTGTPDIQKCWYNAITFATSTNGGEYYNQAAVPNHLLASVPYQFQKLTGPYGYYSPTNVVQKDGYYYLIIAAQPVGVQKRGNCLLRTDQAGLADPTSWRAWNGTDFGVSFINPYVDTTSPPAEHVCEPVSQFNLRGMELSSLTYSTYLKKYVLVGAAVKDPTKQIGGFFISLSNDLINWTEPRLLLEAELPFVTHQCGDADPLRNASLLDPASTARNYETIGRRAYVYLTRFNYFYDGTGNCSQTFDRDLIRIPIEFTDANAPPDEPPPVQPPPSNPPAPLTPAPPSPPVSVKPASQPRVACTSLRKRRARLATKRKAARRMLAKARTAPLKRRYRLQIRSLNRQLKRLAAAKCSR